MDDKLEEKRKYRKDLKKLKRDADLEASGELQMTSLMDIFVNVLIYLLMNYSTSPIDTQQTKERQLPKSTTRVAVKASVSLGVTTRMLLVNKKRVIDLGEDMQVDPQYKQDKKPSSFVIVRLRKALKDAASHAKKISRMGGKSKFTGIVTVVADHRMPFRLLAEIMYTAGQAEFSKFKFAVIKKSS